MSVIFCASANIHSDKFLALVNYLYRSGLETPTLNILHSLKKSLLKFKKVNFFTSRGVQFVF